MLTIFRRHLKSCPHASRSYRRCQCPIHIESSLAGETIRRALNLTSWTAASELVAQWHAAGRIGAAAEEPARIDVAVAKYLEDARSRHLAEATIAKLTTIFEKQFLAWSKSLGLRYVKELTPERLGEWRSTWKDNALAASKKYQRTVGFFYFCMRELLEAIVEIDRISERSGCDWRAGGLQGHQGTKKKTRHVAGLLKSVSLRFT